MEWMILPFKRYADFQGRSRRMEYWMFALFNLIVVTVLMVIAMAMGAGMSTLSDTSDPTAALGMLTGGVGLFIGIYGLAVIIPSIAVAVRRLHDRDMSGWWYLGIVVASFIPFVGFVAAIAFLVLMLLPGTPGPNRYGPDPKDPANIEAFS